MSSSGRGVLWTGIAIAALAGGLWFANRPGPSRVATGDRPESAAGPASAAEIASRVDAAPADARPGRATDEDRRLPADPVPEVPLEIALVVERLPDHAPIARTVVDVDPHVTGEDGAWLVTDPEGRLSVRLPVGTRQIRVHVRGHEVAEEALAAGELEHRVALVPSDTLFGRVVDASGNALAGAQVDLVATMERAYLSTDETSLETHSSVQTWSWAATSVETDADGWYAMDRPGNDARRAELRARLDGLAGSLSVDLPHPPGALPDLVAREAPSTFLVRVLDADEQPLPGALVTCREAPPPRGRDRTDEKGELVVVSPLAPAVIGAWLEGYVLLETRHDGQVVPPGSRVDEHTKLVECVLTHVGGVRVRVVDAETRLPLYIVRGVCELLANGRSLGESRFEANAEGLAWVPFHDSQVTGPPAPPDLVRLSCEKEGYEEGVRLELDPHALPPEPVELALRPLPGWSVFRGRVVRDGEPLPRFQVGLSAQRVLSEHPIWQYMRAWTNDEGRFTVRWPASEHAQTITVYPHWTKWDEFGFLGPLSESEAVAGEHVLELRPAVHVPAVVRGVVRGTKYRYYVSLVDETENGRLVVSTTVNGVPLDSDVDGELHTLLRLPPDRLVQVTLGHVRGGAVHSDGSPPVVYDPHAPRLPLEFEVRPFFHTVRGRVTGLLPEELAHHAVTSLPDIAREMTQASETARLAPDGRFELRCPPGSLELHLFDTTPGSWVGTRARQGLDVDGDVEGVVLVAEPAPNAPR